MTDAIVTAAADAIMDSYSSGVGCAPVRDGLTDGGIDRAYAVQTELIRRWEADGRKLVGRKIGLTAKAVQAQLGVDQPDYGMLFADMERAEQEEIAPADFIAPKVEAEIAFVADCDLDDPAMSLAQLIRSIAYALPAIEIVDSRIADWDISILDTVADNASSGAYVLGGSPVPIDRLDLRLCGMRLDHGGEPVSVGCGMACLGNPLAAALWLARTMANAGRPLLAGEVILSGALGPMVPVQLGGAYRATINGLGSVVARFGEA